MRNTYTLFLSSLLMIHTLNSTYCDSERHCEQVGHFEHCNSECALFDRCDITYVADGWHEHGEGAASQGWGECGSVQNYHERPPVWNTEYTIYISIHLCIYSMVSFNPFPNYDTEVIFSVSQSHNIPCAIRMSEIEDFYLLPLKMTFCSFNYILRKGSCLPHLLRYCIFLHSTNKHTYD